MLHFKRIGLALAVIALCLAGCGCGVSRAAKNGKVCAVTTLFPLYDFTREIGRDRVEVKLLLPPGVEAHAYDPSPKDVVRISKADLFIYTGSGMEPWAHKTVKNLGGKRLVVVDSSRGIPLFKEAERGEARCKDVKGGREGYETENECERHESGGVDPHIWLDPVYAQRMVDNIAAGLSRVDAPNREFYLANAKTYKQKLQALHQKLSSTLSGAPRKTIMYGGHFAFGYFARRYGLENISPYPGFAPDAEPTPQRIAQLIRNMKQSGLKVIYYEELIEPKVAKVIAGQTGAKLLLLHGAHNISKRELQSGVTYLKIMESDLVKLKQGLGIK